MAIANYVTINSKKYRILATDYGRRMEPPKVVRTGVLGNTIISRGPGASNVQTTAVLAIDYAPASGYGTLVDLQTAIEAGSVSYTDHVTGGSEWGSGTFNIVLLDAEVFQLQGSPMPTTGYNVLVTWQKVLT